jgi:cyanophycinase-like exopeptidase
MVFPRRIFVFLFILSACTPTPQPTQIIVNAYATSAATPWLAELYACAEKNNAAINISADSPDIFLRVGEPEMIASPVYQIDEVEILVVAHRENNLQSLTLAEVQDLFAQGNSQAQVWGYPSEADMQRVFDQLVMQGRSVSSSAKIAVSVQNMSEVLKSDPAAIGILPRQSVTGDLREVFSAGRVPVLAVTKEEPQDMVGKLISCLQ